MNRTGLHLAAAAFCLSALTVHAQIYYSVPEGAGFYFRADVGPTFFEDSRLTTFGGPADSPVQFQTGFAADAAVGYAFNRHMGVDIETGFIGAKIDSVPGFFSDNSRLYNVPLLVNATFSFPIPHSNIVPYFGAGAGFADTVFDTDSFGDGIAEVFGRDSDIVPAGQLFAGVRFRLSRGVSLGLAYKFLVTGDSSFSYPPAPNFPVGIKGLRAHSILFTVNVEF